MFVISLFNLKGGVGKTASCVNFAYMAAKDGYKTLLWDLDPQGAAGFYYDVQPDEKDLAKKIIAQSVNIEDAIVPTAYEGIDLIPADISARKLDIFLEENKASKKQLKSILKSIDKLYDFVFIDCPPGFSLLADNIFHASDVVFMPVIPTTLSVRTYEIVKNHFADKTELDKLMCFFSMVDVRKNMHKDVMTQLYKDKRFFEYYIPYMSDIEKMGVHAAPIESYAPSSYAATCYRALWNEIKEGILE